MLRSIALKKISKIKEARIVKCTNRGITIHGWFAELKISFQGEDCIIFTTRKLHQVSNSIEDYHAERHHKNFKAMLLDFYQLEDR